jgi:hypothetical protein
MPVQMCDCKIVAINNYPFVGGQEHSMVELRSTKRSSGVMLLGLAPDVQRAWNVCYYRLISRRQLPTKEKTPEAVSQRK